jgi:hypothetical protein
MLHMSPGTFLGEPNLSASGKPFPKSPRAPSIYLCFSGRIAHHSCLILHLLSIKNDKCSEFNVRSLCYRRPKSRNITGRLSPNNASPCSSCRQLKSHNVSGRLPPNHASLYQGPSGYVYHVSHGKAQYYVSSLQRQQSQLSQCTDCQWYCSTGTNLGLCCGSRFSDCVT